MDTAITKNELVAKLATNAGIELYECTDHGQEYSRIPPFVQARPIRFQQEDSVMPPRCFICSKAMTKVDAPTGDQFLLWGI